MDPNSETLQIANEKAMPNSDRCRRKPLKNLHLSSRSSKAVTLMQNQQGQKRRSIPIERQEVKKQHEMLNQHDPNAKPNFLNPQQNELRSSILRNIHQNQNFKKSFCLFSFFANNKK